jgi:hypothetical protein
VGRAEHECRRGRPGAAGPGRTACAGRSARSRPLVSDAIGVFDEDYVRHDLAQVWQQPGAGERSVAQMLGGSTADKAARLVSFGFPQDTAERVAAGQDDGMGRAGTAPSEDSFVGSDAQRRRAAERAGARVPRALLGGSPTPHPERRSDGGTRNRRLVRAPTSSTPSFSRAIGAVPSNNRRPEPRRTGMTSMRTSSTRPAASS